ncbi:hypothetical protein AMJ80_04700 [bacterium SM23_31]|nr:MAG: hypothetical protein AMJ80_04700 [bacterium SM23_31]
MPKKSILLVMFIILSMLFFTTCSREERTLDFETEIQYDFVFVINIGGQNEFEGDCTYNFMGGPITELSLAKVIEPDIILWRVVTPGFDGIVTPYAHDRLYYPDYIWIGYDEWGYSIYDDDRENSQPILGIMRTHSAARRLKPGTHYRATAKRLNFLFPEKGIEIAQRDFLFVR